MLIKLYCAMSGSCEFLVLSIDILPLVIRFDTTCDIFICFGCGLVWCQISANIHVHVKCNMIILFILCLVLIMSN